MLKRIFDFVVSLLGLIVFSPILIILSLAVWLQDFQSPFYVAPRVGKDEKLFKMIKLRSMVKYADKSGVDSTSANDRRITAVGHFIRAYKLDEFSQLINVLFGRMSFVGPRPNVPRDVALYTSVERKLLSVKPGITDFSSIVFSDEGEILKDKVNPDIAYNQLIRPWKSRLGLVYIEHASFILDLKLIYLTIIAIFSKKRALRGVVVLLRGLGVSGEIIQVAARTLPLKPLAPPGADDIVATRD